MTNSFVDRPPNRTDLVLGTITEISIDGFVTKPELYEALYPKVDGNPEFPRPLNKSIGYSIAGLISKGFVEIVPYTREIPIGG